MNVALDKVLVRVLERVNDCLFTIDLVIAVNILLEKQECITYRSPPDI